MAEADQASGEQTQVETGRDFLEATRDLKYSFDRQKAMQPGDFIRMPWIDFRQWGAVQANGEPEDKNTLPTEGDAKVSITQVLKDQGVAELIVESNGIQRKINGSLFANFGVSFHHH